MRQNCENLYYEEKDAPELEDYDTQSEKQHFSSTYQLKPYEAYEANGYRYKTDKYGRIVTCEGTLRLEDGKRNTAHQTRAGGEFRLETDEGGHLVGRRFGGSEKVDNLVPMHHNLNHGSYEKLESEWATELERNNQVDVKIRCRYGGDSTRPTEFIIKYQVTEPNGFTRVETRRLVNGEEENER